MVALATANSSNDTINCGSQGSSRKTPNRSEVFIVDTITESLVHRIGHQADNSIDNAVLSATRLKT